MTRSSRRRALIFLLLRFEEIRQIHPSFPFRGLFALVFWAESRLGSGSREFKKGGSFLPQSIRLDHLLRVSAQGDQMEGAAGSDHGNEPERAFRDYDGRVCRDLFARACGRACAADVAADA